MTDYVHGLLWSLLFAELSLSVFVALAALMRYLRFVFITELILEENNETNKIHRVQCMLLLKLMFVISIVLPLFIYIRWTSSSRAVYRVGNLQVRLTYNMERRLWLPFAYIFGLLVSPTRALKTLNPSQSWY
jgi:hypothetical protein